MSNLNEQGNRLIMLLSKPKERERAYWPDVVLVVWLIVVMAWALVR